MALSGALTIAIWRGRGWLQAFAAGAMLPHLAGYLVLTVGRESWEVVFEFVVLVLISCVAGVAAAAWHGVLAQHKGMLPVPNLPFIRDWFTNEQDQVR